MSESVASLVKEMKKRKIWDTTTVILVGLDGYSADLRAGEPGAANLFSESTRATLMIKPARKKREGPFNWKIDSNVSLVDVGTTLFEMIAPGEPLPASKFETTSLASALNGPEVNWSADRKIVSESAWPEWRAVGGVRSAVRSGSFLYIFDVNDQLYNTLTDSLEFSPLPLKEPRTLALRDSLAQYLRDHDYVPWQASDALALEKTQLAQELWRERAPAADSYLRLRALSKRHPQDSDLLAWRAILALSRNDWVELKAAAGDDHPVWKYVAAINLGEKVARPLEPCLKALDVHTTEMRKACSDDYVRDIVTWVTETDPKIRDRAMESATKTGLGRALFDRISRQNAVAGDTWDVSRGALSEPPLSDLILALPEMKKYRIILRSKLASRVD